MLEGIKSKLGFADANQSYDDGYYDEGFDDYSEEYGEYGPDYKETDFPVDDAPGARYDPYAPVTTRPAGASRSRSGARSSSVGAAKLVSIDDVRAHTQVPESLNRDPLPPRRVTAASGSFRTMVDATQPAPANTPIARAAAAANRERSESLNSLFTSTADDAASAASSLASQGVQASATASSVTVATATASAFDPYDAYAGTGAAKHSASRSVTVLKPASYSEVERIAKSLKACDVVVLALRNTPDSLSKRILDFSFGVSSALDASVDCVADKVFVISRGAPLTDAERMSLRGQGVL